MSADTTSHKETLEDLDLLPEEGRRRYLKSHSREDLCEILLTACRERDAAKASVERGSELQRLGNTGRTDDNEQLQATSRRPRPLVPRVPRALVSLTSSTN